MTKTRHPSSPVFYVYELVDPRNAEIFYIGKGSMNYGRTGRYRDHIWKAKKGIPGVKNSRIRDILAEGDKPVLNIVVEGLTEPDAFVAEAERVKAKGLQHLTNAIRGGHGGWTGVQSADNHWSRRHPERRLKGDRHPWNRDPELKVRNIEAMRAALARDPSKRPRGNRHGKCKLTDEDVNALRGKYLEGLKRGNPSVTCKVLAKSYGVSITHVSRVLRGVRGGSPIQARKGKLTPRQIAQIVAKRLDGATYSVIGEEFGIHPSRAHQIFKRFNEG